MSLSSYKRSEPTVQHACDLCTNDEYRQHVWVHLSAAYSLLHSGPELRHERATHIEPAPSRRAMARSIRAKAIVAHVFSQYACGTGKQWTAAHVGVVVSGAGVVVSPRARGERIDATP